MSYSLSQKVTKYHKNNVPGNVHVCNLLLGEVFYNVTFLIYCETKPSQLKYVWNEAGNPLGRILPKTQAISHRMLSWGLSQNLVSFYKKRNSGRKKLY